MNDIHLFGYEVSFVGLCIKLVPWLCSLFAGVTLQQWSMVAAIASYLMGALYAAVHLFYLIRDRKARKGKQ